MMICALLLTMTAAADAANILLIVGNVNSHVLYFSRLGSDLAQLGHVARLVVPSNARRPDFTKSGPVGNFTFATYPVDCDTPYLNSRDVSELLLQLALTQSPWEKFSLMYSMGQKIQDHWEEDCVHLINYDDEMKRIRLGRFDFAIMDPIAMHCFYAIPYSLGIPFASLSIGSFGWAYRIPRLPSFASSFGYSDRMTFGERLTTFVVEMTQLQMANKSTFYIDRLAPNRPPLDTIGLLQNASAWFLLEHITIGYAHPLMPNTIQVGDIMAGRAGKPLSAELESFLAGSKQGAMLVSFGSYFDFVPDDVVEKFCKAFADKRINLHIIWKFKNSSVCGGSKRIKALSWLPQNDLLADQRVKLFVSHGGLNSIIESVSHGKPLVIFPISLDQPSNAAAAVQKGFAVRLDIGDFSVESLVDSIDSVLTDVKYTRNAQLAANIMRDRRDTPAQRVSDMISHVLKYGDQHLRTGAFQLSTLQFIMFDIFAALVVAAVVLLLVAILSCCCVWRLCCRCCCRRSKHKVD